MIYLCFIQPNTSHTSTLPLYMFHTSIRQPYIYMYTHCSRGTQKEILAVLLLTWIKSLIKVTKRSWSTTQATKTTTYRISDKIFSSILFKLFFKQCQEFWVNNISQVGLLLFLKDWLFHYKYMYIIYTSHTNYIKQVYISHCQWYLIDCTSIRCS